MQIQSAMIILRGVLEKPGYSKSATEHRQSAAGDRCGRVQMNVDIVGSRRNGPQLSTRHDDDDTDDDNEEYNAHLFCRVSCRVHVPPRA